MAFEIAYEAAPQELTDGIREAFVGMMAADISSSDVNHEDVGAVVSELTRLRYAPTTIEACIDDVLQRIKGNLSTL